MTETLTPAADNPLTADRIRRWRAENPGVRLVLYEADLSGADLRWVNLYEADLSWANLSGANLSGTNLRWANLSGTNLSGTNLYEADLRWANLYEADLSGADLYEADLSGADLSGADLRWADLSEANLRWANLSGADLSEANLRWTNLSGTNLSGANLSGVQVSPGSPILTATLPSGPASCWPTPDGWVARVGCWGGGKTVADLRALIAQDEGWPEAEGDELARRRPILAAWCDLAEAHTAYHGPGPLGVLK